MRGLRCHLLEWGNPSQATADRPTLVLAHGWMDVAASFQFMVDALEVPRHIVALDWRGFGGSETPQGDGYWFPDYLGDLDGILDAVSPDRPVDLLGHSMGGNVVMMYAGIRPHRIRRLVNLEGFGMPAARPDDAPAHYAAWLDELKEPVSLKPYASAADVAERLRRNNPLLREDRAAWLATRWAQPREDGQWHILGDPAHKRRNPVMYQLPEVLACWRRITAPVLWAEGDRTDQHRRWGDRYTRDDFEARLGMLHSVERCVLAPAGHMLHHDQPEALARRVEAFLG